MVKRTLSEEDRESEQDAKRSRLSSTDRLSKLSDELVLRILSFLSSSELVPCERLSHKYKALAGDGQLWKSLYYDRWVRPRASRLPAIKLQDDTATESLQFASKASRWLGDEHLVRGGGRTNWKRQYKLRHNWCKGNCAVKEIEVSDQVPVPPILVQMHEGVIYMADQEEGLRAYSAKGEQKMLAQSGFEQRRRSPPTSLAVDINDETGTHSRIIVGFEDGSFSLHLLDQENEDFHHQYSHEPSTNGVVSAVALTYPYAVTMTATQLLSLYHFRPPKDGSPILQPPRLLHSLKSHTVWPPLSTLLRIQKPNIIISIAYSLPTYLSGWTVGIQEVHIDPKGTLLKSRLSSAIDQHYRPLAFSTIPIIHHLPGPMNGSLATSTAMELRHIHAKPTSLSYTHPYLLVSHPDNTLTLYLVTSTADALSISAGSRLWGHTSSVSGAHVGGRGKAVSVSRRGDELRVWELEGGLASNAAKRRLASGDLSVKIRPERHWQTGSETTQAGFDLVHGASRERSSEQRAGDEAPELALTRGWIGFDDENVVVLKEESRGRQALVVYDFT